MSTLVLGIIVIIYIFILAWLGWLGYKQTKNSSDYLLGDRKINPMIMALSYGATFISTSAIVGFGGVAATFGMGIQWLCALNMFMGVIIAVIFFGGKTRQLGAKHDARTFPQLMGSHYDSPLIKRICAAVIFIGMPIYAAVVMKGGAVFIEQVFSMDMDVALLIFTVIVAIYVISGGIKGVLYTDALQGIIMFISLLFILIWFYKSMDMGFIEANRNLTNIAHLVPDHLRELGHQGWTAMPVTGSPQWYTLVTSLIMGVGIGCLAQPQLVVRFMMVENDKQLNRGILIGCLFIFFTVGSIYHVGALSNLFFLKTEGMIASELVKDIDRIIPLYIDKAMPDWFGVIFMLCMLSASMSTLSAQFHTMGAAFGADAFPKLGRSKNPNSTIAIRIGVTLFIVISYTICYTLNASVIARGTALFMGVCAATFLPVYFCSLYCKWVTKEGALASICTGAFASIFAMLFLHKAEASAIGLCRALTGQDVLIESYPWPMIDPLLFALPLSVAAIIIVSLATKKTAK